MRIIRIYSTPGGLKAKLIIGLALLLVAAGLALIALLALGIMLFVLPALVLTAVIYALLPKGRAGHGSRRENAPQVLEGRYRVLHNKDDDLET